MEKTWDSLLEYIESRLAYNRKTKGKYNSRNSELHHLLLEMSKVDSKLSVPVSFDDFEEFYNGKTNKYNY